MHTVIYLESYAGFRRRTRSAALKKSLSKEWYDSSVVQCLFRRGDIVRLRVHHLFSKAASKLASTYSAKHDVLETRGVNVQVRDIRSGKEL